MLKRSSFECLILVSVSQLERVYRELSESASNCQHMEASLPVENVRRFFDVFGRFFRWQEFDGRIGLT
jgi:hypothetical protein